jgi:hypothetical protein
VAGVVFARGLRESFFCLSHKKFRVASSESKYVSSFEFQVSSLIQAKLLDQFQEALPELETRNPKLETVLPKFELETRNRSIGM